MTLAQSVSSALVMASGLLAGGVAAALALPDQAAANEYAPQLERFLDERVRPFLQHPLVIDSIREQNTAHASFSQTEIDNLDQQWRAEAQGGGGPLIQAWMARELSQYLTERQAETDGMIAELFVTDNKGLNVGQSEPTSDLWQGDEAKWQKTFLVGPDAVFVDEIDFDESSGMFSSQVNAAIADPDTGEVIGAVTVGVNVEMLD